MAKCGECKKYGYKRTNQQTLPCALCGEKRCEDHSIWVPAHELEKNIESVQRITEILRSEPHDGWYVFCTKQPHIPRGLPNRYGKDMKGGKLISPVTDDQKKKGLEFIRMWEIGVIERGLETRWQPLHFVPSCSLAKAMIIISQIYNRDVNSEGFLQKIFKYGFESHGGKKLAYDAPTWDQFSKYIGKTKKPEILDFVKLLCERCMVIPCTNRQAEFFDQKLFDKLIKKPDKIKK
ncbi:MAG: hypothetical protein ACTSQZ_02175 [Candidatus Thorarchaeota archaeon]